MSRLRTFQINPGSVAALLWVYELETIDYTPPSLEPVSVVFLSKEKGAVVGPRDKPLADYGWPIRLQAEINRYFGTVFALEHEKWTGRGPSPRAQFVDACEPWMIDVVGET